MASFVQERWLVGKTIKRVDMGRGRARRHDPRLVVLSPEIEFTDGSRLIPVYAETDWEPGVSLIYIPAKRRR